MRHENCDIQLKILNKLSLWNYSSSSSFLWLHVTGEKKRKFVLDNLKPLMVAKYYSTSSTGSFYYPSVLMNCTWYYPSLNSLYNHIFIKRKTVGKSELLLNHTNALVTPKQKVLSSITNHWRLQKKPREVVTRVYWHPPQASTSSK